MKRFYWRCMDGHYFESRRCPFDGWTSDELLELATAADRLRSKDINPSIAALSTEGVSDAALGRAIVVEFGSERSTFDALSPDCYVIDGKSVKLRQAGKDFH